MEFVSREHFDTYLRGLKYLGQGSQGACYLNTKNNTVYKVFNDYFDEEDAGYTEDFLLSFSNIKNRSRFYIVNVNKHLLFFLLCVTISNIRKRERLS